MKRSIVVSLLGVVLYCTPVSAAPLSADDFLPPVQAQTEEAKVESQQVKQPEQVRKEEGIGGQQAVSAATAQDAVNSAVKFLPVGGGCEQIKFPSGFGWVATGVSTYTFMQNPTATLNVQRLAYQKAYLIAKKNLAAALFGLSTEGKETLLSETRQVISDTENLLNISENHEDAVTECVNGMLRGYVVYNVEDKQDKANGAGTVTVTIVTTPKTMGQTGRIDADSLSAESVRDGLNQVLSELSSGLMPPVGGKTITVQKTGELAFVGFGSDVVTSHSNPAIQAKMVLESQKIATMHARNALCGIILGDSISSESKTQSSTQQMDADFEAIQSEDPVAATPDTSAIKKLDATKSTFLTTKMSSEQITSLRSGILPPGVMVKTFMNEEGTLAEAVAIYLPSMTENAAAAGKAMQQSQIVAPIGGAQNCGNQAPQAPQQGATGQVMRDADL